MIIAVSMRVTNNAGYYEPRDAISHDWIRFFDQRGLTPVLVPNVLRDPAGYLRAAQATALLLTGGNDLGAVQQVSAEFEIETKAPTESPVSQDTSDERDQTETCLLDAAVRSGMPVFGVCRGLQFINAYFGGRLCRNLSTFGQHVAVNHPVQLLAEAARWLPYAGLETNSFHNHGVTLDDVSGQLIPFAVADDKVVEGVRHATLPITAVQWHPERPHPGQALDHILIERWLSKCA